MPRTLRLPRNPDKDLWSFYKFLTCTSTTENYKLLIILSIPLLDAQDTYSIYKVHNLPALMTNQSNSIIDNDCSMVAQYNLEANSIAVNTDRTQYMLFSSDELRSCSNPLMGFCFAKSPVYKLVFQNYALSRYFYRKNKRLRNTVK